MALKVLLPMAALALMAVILAYASLPMSNTPANTARAYSDTSGAAGEVRMTNPHITGRDAHRRPYAITAASAVQAPDNPDRILMEIIHAEIGAPGADRLEISAGAGVFARPSRRLDLFAPIVATSGQGYEFQAQSAAIDLAAGNLSSDMPVSISGPLGTLRADSMTARGGGQVMVFRGGVRMKVHMAASSAP